MKKVKRSVVANNLEVGRRDELGGTWGDLKDSETILYDTIAIGCMSEQICQNHRTAEDKVNSNVSYRI
jgi:hypothetical protein